jgi:hypothetical protein
VARETVCACCIVMDPSAARTTAECHGVMFRAPFWRIRMTEIFSVFIDGCIDSLKKVGYRLVIAAA